MILPIDKGFVSDTWPLLTITLQTAKLGFADGGNLADQDKAGGAQISRFFPDLRSPNSRLFSAYFIVVDTVGALLARSVRPKDKVEVLRCARHVQYSLQWNVNFDHGNIVLKNYLYHVTGSRVLDH